MIEESYVSFDTAKMLKEAGFSELCRRYYLNNGSLYISIVVDDYNGMPFGIYSCPTQGLVARWLREVHRIVVDATFIPPSADGNVWQYFIGEMDDMVWEGDFEPSEREYTTYEAALEEGLQEAIKLIKK